MAYTDAKFEESLKLSKARINQSLTEEQNRLDAKTELLADEVEHIIQNSLTKLRDDFASIVANMLSQHTLSHSQPKDIALTPNSKRSRDTSTLTDGSPNTAESLLPAKPEAEQEAPSSSETKMVNSSTPPSAPSSLS